MRLHQLRFYRLHGRSDSCVSWPVREESQMFPLNSLPLRSSSPETECRHSRIPSDALWPPAERIWQRPRAVEGAFTPGGKDRISPRYGDLCVTTRRRGARFQSNRPIGLGLPGSCGWLGLIGLFSCQRRLRRHLVQGFCCCIRQGRHANRAGGHSRMRVDGNFVASFGAEGVLAGLISHVGRFFVC